MKDEIMLELSALISNVQMQVIKCVILTLPIFTIPKESDLSNLSKEQQKYYNLAEKYEAQLKRVDKQEELLNQEDNDIKKSNMSLDKEELILMQKQIKEKRE